MRYEDIPEIIENYEDYMDEFLLEDTKIKVRPGGEIEFWNIKDGICSESVIEGVLSAMPEDRGVTDSSPHVRTAEEGRMRVY